MNDNPTNTTGPTKTFDPVPKVPAFYTPSKPAHQLALMEARFSAIPGQPSLIYFEAATATIVSICPTPQVALVSSLPDTLNFVTIAHRPAGEFSKDDAIQYMERAANMIDFAELVPADVKEFTFQVALDPEAVTNEAGVGYRGVLCIPVSKAVLNQNLSLAILQGKAAQRVAELLSLRAAHSTH